MFVHEKKLREDICQIADNPDPDKISEKIESLSMLGDSFSAVENATWLSFAVFLFGMCGLSRSYRTKNSCFFPSSDNS
jgi:hypothetical protein